MFYQIILKLQKIQILFPIYLLLRNVSLHFLRKIDFDYNTLLKARKRYFLKSKLKLNTFFTELNGSDIKI